MHYDISIKNGTIIDPKTKRSTVANIGILDGKIASITREKLDATKVLNVAVKIVCPGFIDPHAHVEGNEDCAKVMAAMGVTSVINGNCGNSPEDFAGFLKEQEQKGFLLNQYEQVGHTTLRELAGNKNRYEPSSKEQIYRMKNLAEEAFHQGAYGLSFGLEYVPGSSKDEVMELASVAARYGKPVSIHTRTDCYNGLNALQEAIDISRITGAAVNISHLAYMWGLGMAAEALRIIENAMAEGLDISTDSGLYHAFATQIGSAVFDEGCVEKWHSDYSCIVAGTGKYRGQHLTREMYLELRQDYPEETGIGMVGKEYEVYEILERPYVMVGTDAGTQYDNGLPGHPQDAGTYPKFFRTMIREQNRINLVDAVNRCTYMVAQRFGIENKGFIAKGADADLVIFDLNTIGDRADYPCFGDTDTRPEGIEYVIINGVLAVEHKKVLDVKPGVMKKAECKLWKF